MAGTKILADEYQSGIQALRGAKEIATKKGYSNFLDNPSEQFDSAEVVSYYKKVKDLVDDELSSEWPVEDHELVQYYVNANIDLGKENKAFNALIFRFNGGLDVYQWIFLPKRFAYEEARAKARKKADTFEGATLLDIQKNQKIYKKFVESKKDIILMDGVLTPPMKFDDGLISIDHYIGFVYKNSAGPEKYSWLYKVKDNTITPPEDNGKMSI
jgi:hypothetical protein